MTTNASNTWVIYNGISAVDYYNKYSTYKTLKEYAEYEWLRFEKRRPPKKKELLDEDECI